MIFAYHIGNNKQINGGKIKQYKKEHFHFLIDSFSQTM